jgi:hypothetical protein
MSQCTTDGDQDPVADLQRAPGAPPRNRKRVWPRKLAPIRQEGMLRKGNLESASAGETWPRGFVGSKPSRGSKPRRRSCPGRKARAISTEPLSAVETQNLKRAIARGRFSRGEFVMQTRKTG